MPLADLNDIPAGIPEASAWSMAVGQLGKASIWAALIFFILGAVIYGLQPKLPKLEVAAKICFTLGCLGLFSTFGCLATLFINNQFQYQYVWEHGDITTDFKYKISGIWNAQEGSFLLWSCTSAAFGLLSVRGTGPYRRWFTVVYSGFLAVLTAILAYDTPFELIKAANAHGKWFVIPNGNGMTPSLQNYWDVIHPPTIFSGFGSLTIFFAYACAALLTGNAKDWVSRVRPWSLITVSILGLGICMGGLWAYETQGWGGFWAWDPVENVSFVPWLFTVVFAHGLLVQATRGKWSIWNLAAGALPFISYAYGTFLTRSGLLDKVSNHSFANMDASALSILRWFVILLTAGFIGLMMWKGKKAAAMVPSSEPDPNGLHREGFYRFGMMFISLFAVVVALGMSWPVIETLRRGEGSKVEEWLYHQIAIWFFIPIMLLMAIAPFVGWRATPGKELWNRIFTVLCLSIGTTGIIQTLFMMPKIGIHALPDATVAGPFHLHVKLVYWMILLVFCCVFMASANLWRAVELWKNSKTGIGGFIAHIGIATLLAGLIISRGYEQQEDIYVRKGSPAQGLDYLVSYKGSTSEDLTNRNRKILFDVTGPDHQHFVASPGNYQFGPANEKPKDMVWPHVERSLSHDMYLSMAAPAVEVWDDPKSLTPGKSIDVGESTLEYLAPTMKGKAGSIGVTFGAKFRLTTDGSDGERHQFTGTPVVQVAEGGLNHGLARLGPDYAVAILGMDPSDKSVQVVMFYSPPIYPIRIFYKPLTSLVWLGAGIMTFGGLLSAWSRRRVKVRGTGQPLSPKLA